MNPTLAEAKAAAKALRRRLAREDVQVSHGQALEVVADQLGYADWNTARSALGSPAPPRLGTPVPVLRIQDESVARDFYVRYLGLAVAWGHRFEPGLPIYLRLQRDEVTLDLSEHHGDGTPGSVCWVPVVDLATLHAELAGRRHPRLRPGIDEEAPGGPTMEVTDPFGNVLRFCQPGS